MTSDIFAGTPIYKDLKTGAAWVDWMATEFETINSLYVTDQDGYMIKTAKDENVATLNNFLFEADDTPLIVQKTHALKLFDRGVCNRIIFSGNKSVHVRITIKPAAATKDQYTFIWYLLKDKYFSDFKVDSSCKNPARLTRAPNGTNSKTHKKQELIALSNNVCDLDWISKWREKEKEENIPKLGASWQPSFYEKNEDEISSDTWQDKLKKADTDKARLVKDFPTMGDGERHENLWKVLSWLKWAGATQDEAAAYVKESGITDWKSAARYVYRD
jgi:hypothetical protein